MKIFITGCNKSGTTLLLRMFHAFNDTGIFTREVNIKSFCSYKESTKRLVAKRTVKSIFSNILSDKDISIQLEMIKDNNIVIINCIRNGEDVVLSNNNIQRYIASIDQAEKYSDVISLTVKYEDLIENTDKVQKDVENLLGVKAVNKFSSYPDFVPRHSYRAKYNTFRPIEPSRINKNPGHYVKMFDRFKEIIEDY